MFTKTKEYMFSRKGLSVLIIVLLVSFVVAFARLTETKPVEKYQRIMTIVGKILEQGHFQPKKIDDAFSKEVFKNYISRLDGSKNLFLKSDVEALRKYETQIDEQIHGAPLDFFYDINTLYVKASATAEQYCKEILSKPFDFTVKEVMQPDASKMDHPATEAARKENWHKQLKMMTLERYSDMLETQEKNKTTEGFKIRTNAEIELDARERVRKIIEKNFARNKRPESEEERFSMFVNTVTNLMDPHTDFFPPVEKRVFDEKLSRKFYGIGALLTEEDGKIKINNVSSGGPAWKSGEIQAGDIIVKVGQGNSEPVDITGYAMDDAIKLIRGDKDSEVHLTIKKTDGTTKVVVLKRGELKIEEAYVKSSIINGPHKVGYIYVPDFYADFQNPNGARCSKDVAKEIAKLKAENVEGIILDVRDNGGGSLYEVVQMVGLFIKTGPVVQVKDRQGTPSILSDNDATVLYDGPLTVMVNEYSASASEIFAAAIQDYGRGVIIGSTSYGKGTVQQAVPLERPSLFTQEDNLGTIHLTLQKYYRVNGGSTQLHGVTPDIILPGYLEFYKVREKDNPTSLPWDQLQKLNYTKWNNEFDVVQLRNSSNQRVKTTGVFDTLRTNAIWLAARNERPLALQLDEYRKEQKKVEESVRKVRQVMRLKDSLVVTLTPQDLAELKENKTKQDSYERFRSIVNRDIYVAETMHVVNDMINMRKLVKN
jgi:carboxyl-terminal processing protease